MKDVTQTRQIFRDRIDKELAAAEKAQAAGNDGMMRVCARRAVGHAPYGENFRPVPVSVFGGSDRGCPPHYQPSYE